MHTQQPLLLCIETATPNCSVALFRGNDLLASRASYGQKVHSRMLMPFIEEVLKAGNSRTSDLHAVVLGKGPGSYTGLRIGTMAAKGLCYGLDIPLLAVNTLAGMAHGYENHHPEGGKRLLCPMIDARRMEVYMAVYDAEGKIIVNTQACVVEKGTFDFLLKDHPVTFFGEGIEKCRPLLDHPNACFAGEWLPDARYLAGIALPGYTEKAFEDVAAFEPFYLKDFVPEHPAHKIRNVLKG